MYAVFSACGKQYKVRKGDTVQLELLTEGLGETKSFTEVLLVGEGADIKIGRPFVDNAEVKAEILAVEKGPKHQIMHYKRRKQFKRHVGHRQPFTRILITAVSNGAQSDALSTQERDALMKRIGFASRDEYNPAEMDDTARAEKAEKLKKRGEKQKEKAASFKTGAPVKKPAKKASAKKAPAKKAGAAKAKKATAKKETKKDE